MKQVEKGKSDYNKSKQKIPLKLKKWILCKQVLLFRITRTSSWVSCWFYGLCDEEGTASVTIGEKYFCLSWHQRTSWRYAKLTCIQMSLLYFLEDQQEQRTLAIKSYLICAWQVCWWSNPCLRHQNTNPLRFTKQRYGKLVYVHLTPIKEELSISIYCNLQLRVYFQDGHDIIPNSDQLYVVITKGGLMNQPLTEIRCYQKHNYVSRYHGACRDLWVLKQVQDHSSCFGELLKIACSRTIFQRKRGDWKGDKVHIRLKKELSLFVVGLVKFHSAGGDNQHFMLIDCNQVWKL